MDLIGVVVVIVFMVIVFSLIFISNYSKIKYYYLKTFDKKRFVIYCKNNCIVPTFESILTNNNELIAMLENLEQEMKTTFGKANRVAEGVINIAGKLITGEAKGVSAYNKLDQLSISNMSNISTLTNYINDLNGIETVENNSKIQRICVTIRGILSTIHSNYASGVDIQGLFKDLGNAMSDDKSGYSYTETLRKNNEELKTYLNDFL